MFLFSSGERSFYFNLVLLTKNQATPFRYFYQRFGNWRRLIGYRFMFNQSGTSLGTTLKMLGSHLHSRSSASHKKLEKVVKITPYCIWMFLQHEGYHNKMKLQRFMMTTKVRIHFIKINSRSTRQKCTSMISKLRTVFDIIVWIRAQLGRKWQYELHRIVRTDMNHIVHWNRVSIATHRWRNHHHIYFHRLSPRFNFECWTLELTDSIRQ